MRQSWDGAEGLVREKMEVLLEELRPMLRADGGDVELIDVNEAGIVQIRFLGVCGDCSGSLMSLKRGIEGVIRERVPGVREVVAV